MSELADFLAGFDKIISVKVYKRRYDKQYVAEVVLKDRIESMVLTQTPIKLFNDRFTYLRKLYYKVPYIDCSGGRVKYFYKNRKNKLDVDFEYLAIDDRKRHNTGNYIAMASKYKIMIMHHNVSIKDINHPNIYVYGLKCTENVPYPQNVKYYYCDYEADIVRALECGHENIIVSAICITQKMFKLLYEGNIKKLRIMFSLYFCELYPLTFNPNIRKLDVKCNSGEIPDISHNTSLIKLNWNYKFWEDPAESITEILERNKSMLECRVKSARKV